MEYAARRRQALALGLAALPLPALSQAWPQRPIRIVNPWPPGGPGDQIIRPIASRLQETLGQPIVVENRAGANGTIGANLVATAPADGHTLYFGHTGALTISPVVQSHLPYDSIRDLTPITQILSQGSVLVSRASLPVATAQELIDYSRARPGEVNLGSIGVASTTHLFGELIAAAAGIRFTHVPYPGAAPLVTDLLAGRVDISLLGLPAVAPHVASGQIRALAITSARPPRIAPDMPTLSRTLPGFETETWYGMLGPARLPPEILAKLHREFAAAIRSPEISAILVRDSYEPVGNSPEEFGTLIRRDLETYRGLVRRIDLRIG
jgi:tripartite-type tricarboxylate transporter receptor subunit TctC